jgi:hypothetical protein
MVVLFEARVGRGKSGATASELTYTGTEATAKTRERSSTEERDYDNSDQQEDE